MINHNQLLRLILPFFIIFALFASCSNERTVNALIEKAKHELSEGSESKAVSLYQKVLKIDSENEKAKEALSFIFLQKNRPQESERLAKEILSRNPNNPNAYSILAELSVIKWDLESAVKYYRMNLALNPRYTDSHLGLGYIYRKQKKYKEAESELLKHVELWPNRADGYTEFGKLFLDQKNLAKAEENFLKAFQLEGRRYDELIRLGKLFRENGEYQTELELLEVAKKKIVAPDLDAAYQEAKENLQKKQGKK